MTKILEITIHVLLLSFLYLGGLIIFIPTTILLLFIKGMQKWGEGLEKLYNNINFK